MVSVSHSAPHCVGRVRVVCMLIDSEQLHVFVASSAFWWLCARLWVQIRQQEELLRQLKGVESRLTHALEIEEDGKQGLLRELNAAKQQHEDMLQHVGRLNAQLAEADNANRALKGDVSEGYRYWSLFGAGSVLRCSFAMYIALR